ncbi:hypothetical protein EBR21_18130, partial [bacterium]|nr:hypothetical protein [bacterium]
MARPAISDERVIINPSEKATTASPLNPTFALVGVHIFSQFSIFFGQPQIPAQSEVQGVQLATTEFTETGPPQ